MTADSGSKSETKLIPKSWGYEKILCNGKYCGKVLVIVKGHRTSLHFHQLKDETFYIQKGKVWVYYSDETASIKEKSKPDNNGVVDTEFYSSMTKISLGTGDVFHIPPRRVHQIIAVEDTELIEFSTKHFDEDSIRLINGE